MMKQRLYAGVLALGLMLAPVGCGTDDNSTEAKLEKAMMALDRGDFTSAETILLALCPDPNTCPADYLALLGDAQMGIAGVELPNLLLALDPANIGAGNTAAFDALNTLFGTNGITATDVTTLGNALTTLQTIANPTASDNLQIGMAAAAHMVAAVTVVTDPTGSGTLNATLVDQPLVDAVILDLGLVTSSLLGVVSDVNTDLNGLVADIEAAGGGVVNGTVEVAELANFVTALNLP